MKVNLYKSLLAVLGFGFVLTSCTEDIDTSNRYTFTGETCTDYIANHEDFSEFYRLIKKVPLSDYSKSSVAQLLSARGNFVVFAPTNKAIATYLTDSVGAKLNDVENNIIVIPDTLTSTQYLDDKNVADSLERIIVYNAVINRGDNESSFWYINDMCESRYSELPVANLNGRYLTVKDPVFEVDTITGKEIEKCRIISGDLRWEIRNRDVEVFNGVVHEMNDVIAPSNDNIYQILVAKGSQYVTWGKLMEKTGIAAELTDPLKGFEDYEYKKMYEEGVFNFSGASEKNGYYYQKGVGTESDPGWLPQRREFGFTIFAETDEVLAGIGVHGSDEASLSALKSYLTSKGAKGAADDNYGSDDNIVRQWLAYHIVPQRMTYDALVVHYNEQGYTPFVASKKPTIPISEYYQTYGEPYRLLKFTEGRNTGNGSETGGVRLNRFFKVNPEAKSINDFEKEVYDEGIYVSKTCLEALNGLVYPIEEVLVYDDNASDKMGSERIRFDISSQLPEMITNKWRRPLANYVFGRNIAFSVKNSKNIQYFTRLISNNEESRINYLPGTGSNWGNMLGDEFNVEGSFDLTMQLPPVPKTGTYELRYGISANSSRGMAQIYFGSNPKSLPAAGIPMDVRTGGINRYASQTVPANTGWEEDTDDEAANQETDKKMHNKGFMKAPATYLLSPGSSFSVKGSLREANYSGDRVIRYVLLRDKMEAGKLYYVRFKDVLGKDNAQFFFDYMELCPKSVYDNPNEPEDKW